MINTILKNFPRFLIFILFLFVSCTDYYPCDTINSDQMIITSDKIHVNYVTEWKEISSNQHKIVFRFGERELLNGDILSYRVYDICTSGAFSARLVMHSNLDYSEIETPFGARVEKLKLMIWYPSVPPSNKICTSVENRDYHAINTFLPRPSNGGEFNSTWVDLGVEIQFKTEIGNGFSEDLTMIKKELESFIYFLEFREL